MPYFSTAPSTSLSAAIRRAVSGGGGLDGMQQIAIDQAAASTAQHQSLAQKARAEAEALLHALAQRNDPRIAEQFASNAAGLDLPTGRRLASNLRGDMEQPAPADIDDAATVGREAEPFPMAAPNVPQGIRERFQAASASLLANQLATGKTNAEQLVHAAGRGQENAVLGAAADAARRGDVAGVNLNAAGVLGKKELTPFKTGAEGITTNEYTGTRDESGPTNLGHRAATEALKRSRDAAGSASSAHAGLFRAQTDAARGEITGGKAPPGYAWGPKDESGKATLYAIPGGPAAPSGAASAGNVLSGPELLASMPKEKAAQVKALAEGRMQFPGSMALKSPYWQDMLSTVAQYDPTFDQVNYNGRVAVRKGFTSGKEAQSLNALNTVMGHLNDMDKAGEALNNTDYPLINQAMNAVGANVSPDLKSRLNAFNLTRQAVASEMERAYRGTGGNVTEIEAWKKTLDNADSPQAIRASIKQGVQLLASKVEALGAQYSKGLGTTKEGLQLLDPKAQAIYQRFLNDGGAPAGRGARPKGDAQAPSQADLEYTAKKRGMTVEQVKAQLGIE